MFLPAIVRLYGVMQRPAGGRLVLTGVPDRVDEGPLVYLTGLRQSLVVAYANRDLEIFNLGMFPIWLDTLDRTYFFSVDHRRVNERSDPVHALQEGQPNYSIAPRSCECTSNYRDQVYYGYYPLLHTDRVAVSLPDSWRLAG